MGLEPNGLAPKQIYAPEAVLDVTNDRESRRPRSAAWFGVVVFCQYPPDDVLIDLDPKAIGDLLSDPRAAEPRVAPFHLDDDVDQFLGGTFGTRFRSSVRRKKPMVLALDQRRVKSKQCRRLQEDSGPDNTPSAEK